MSYTQSQACVNEWMYAGASATPVLNIMIGGSESRNVISKLPLEGVGAMAFPGARIKSYFINGFQAPSLYIEPLDCELKVAGAELTKMIDSELQAFNKRLSDAKEEKSNLVIDSTIPSTTSTPQQERYHTNLHPYQLLQLVPHLQLHHPYLKETLCHSLGIQFLSTIIYRRNDRASIFLQRVLFF